jgi:hypothetical protein
MRKIEQEHALNTKLVIILTSDDHLLTTVINGMPLKWCMFVSVLIKENLGVLLLCS